MGVFAVGKERSWRAGVRTAIALLALTVISLATADVSSLTLSSTDVASGGSVTGTVTAPVERTTTRVTLASSQPAVATVPASVSVGRLGRATFSVNAVVGAAGCTFISARVGTTPAKSAQLFVQAPATSGMGITFSANPIVGGGSATGRVVVLQPGTNFTAQLSSSNPAVTVPATVQLSPEEAGNYAGTFPITSTLVSPSTCSVITAKHGSSQVRKVLKVFTAGG